METKDADKNGAKDNEKAETPSEQKESKKPSSGKPDQLKVAKKLQKIRKSLKKEKKKKKEDAARVRRTKKDRKESKRRKEANLKDKTQPIVGTEAQADEGIALKNVQAKEAGSSRSPTRPPARPPTLSPTLTATLSPTLPPTLPPLPTGEQFEKMSEFFAAEVALDDVSPEQGPSELVSKRTQMMQKLTKLTTVDTSPAASPTTTITVEEEAKEPERAAKKPFLEKEEGVGASEQATEKIEIPIEETVFKSSPMLQDLFSPVIKLKRLLVLERLHMAIRDNDMKTVASMCNGSELHVNDVLGGTSALSYAVIVNSPLSMIQLLLDRDADVQDAHLFAIHYDRRTLLPVLLDSLNSKNGPTAEYRVVTKSYRFAPYSTPILVAAKNNNRYMISFLRHRKHELARPHKAACSCAQCDLSAGPGQRRKLQELLDTYSALTAPMYLHQCEQNVLGACFVYGRSVDQTLLHLRFVSLPADVEQSFGQLLLSIEAHACSLIQNVRTDKQMQFLMQSDIEEYPNNSVNYPLWQCSTELGWNEFLHKSAIQEFRNLEWVGTKALDYLLFARLFGRLLTNFLHPNDQNSRLSLQAKHICNAIVYTCLCMFQLVLTVIPLSRKQFWALIAVNLWALWSHVWVVIRRRSVYKNHYKGQGFCPTNTLFLMTTIMYVMHTLLELIGRFVKVRPSIGCALTISGEFSKKSIILLQMLQLLLIGSFRAYNATQNDLKYSIINSVLFAFNWIGILFLSIWFFSFLPLFENSMTVFVTFSQTEIIKSVLIANLIFICMHELTLVNENLPKSNLSFVWDCYAVDLLHGFTERPLLLNLLENVWNPGKKTYVKFSHEDEIDYIMFSLINRWDVKRLETDQDKEPHEDVIKKLA